MLNTAIQASPYLCGRLPPISVIEAEKARICCYLLMSAEFSQSLRRQVRQRLRTQSMIVLWGALQRETADVGEGMERSPLLRPWLIECTTKALKALPGFLTSTDMDEAADVFVGGPVVGKLARLWGPTRLDAN